MTQEKLEYWVGVKSRPPQTVFRARASKITQENYPEYAYVRGPFASQELAQKDAKTHVNVDGTFTDPFCNNGQGR